jgi:peptidoglycan/xylan/chitin deacetylase (PgdA/CDA1 family)
MYHSISERDEGQVHPYYRTAVSPIAFARQMNILQLHGYSVIDLHRVLSCSESDEPLPTKPVVLTFDDGYQDFLLHAFPVLQEHGWTATVFLPTAFISDNRRTFQGEKCLTWGEVRELASNGIRFGSHTVTHSKLRLLEKAALRRELEQSKKTIEDRLGKPADVFSSPFAFPEHDRAFVADLQSMLQEFSYKCAVSTVIGTVDMLKRDFFLKRLPIGSNDDDSLFQAKLSGAYDWFHAVQYAAKYTKERMLPWRTAESM